MFCALKTKHDTPKYGLIYHVSTLSSLYEIDTHRGTYRLPLSTESLKKIKGKMARMVATKAAPSICVDTIRCRFQV